MDLLKHPSELSLYNQQWPIRTVSFSDPPGFTYPASDHSCSVDGCLRAEASRVLGAYVRKSVLSRNCVIMPGSSVEESIIGDGVVVGENCRLKKVIIDSHNILPPGTEIGFDADRDREHFYIDPGSGIVVIGMPRMQLRKSIERPKEGFDWSSFS